MTKPVGEDPRTPGPKLPGPSTIEMLSNLGRKASDITVENIETKGLGEGLPPIVPVGWDRDNQRFLSLRTEIESYRERPERRTGMATMQTLQAFYGLINRHKGQNSAVFADLNWRKPEFTAVIDYHHDGVTDKDKPHLPQNLNHRIYYPFPLSEEWKAWIAGDGKPMEQGDFAALIEDRIAEISAPNETEKDELEDLFKTAIADPFEIVQLSRGLKVSVESAVGRMVTLQTGETEMIFEEVHKDGGGQKLIVPGLFMLSLPVFFRGEKQRIPVRLRYRANGGKVTWLYQMWRPDTYVTEAVEKALDVVRVETGLPAYEGSPEA